MPIALATRDIGDFLEDFAAGSDGQVKLVRRFPEDDEDDLRKAQIAGVPPRQFNVRSQGELQIKASYLGLSMTYVDQRETIPFVSSFDGFEYRMASLINRMVEDQKKSVAFLTGHGQAGPSGGYQTFAALLTDAYEVREMNAAEDPAIDLSGVDVLVIGGPTQAIPDETANAVVEYIANGGKALLMIDSIIIDQSQLIAGENRYSFKDLPERFGVIVENDLVFDLQANETLSFNTQVGSVFLPYPFWVRAPVIDKKVAGNVESAVLPWASSLGISESQRELVEVIPILETSEFAAIDFTYRDLRPNSQTFEEITPDNLVQSLVAVAVAEKAGDGGEAYRIVVVGDSGWLTDTLVSRSQENVALALNLVDWLAQEDRLASVRSKVVSSRDLLYSSPTHESAARWLNIAGVPLLFILFGAVRSIRRRRFGFTLYGQAAGRQGREKARRVSTGGRRVKSRQVGFVLMALIAVGIAGLLFRVFAAGSDEVILEGLVQVSSQASDRVLVEGYGFTTELQRLGDAEQGAWFVDDQPVFEPWLQQFWQGVDDLYDAQLISTNPANHERMGIVQGDAIEMSFFQDRRSLQEKFIVGTWKPAARLCYVRRAGHDETYGIPCPGGNIFDPDPDRWKNPVVASIPPNEIAEIQYIYRDEQFLLRPNEEGEWFVTGADGTESPARPVALNSILSVLQLVIASGFEDEEVADTLNFTTPDATVRVITREDAPTPGTRLRFLQRDDRSFHLKIPTTSTVYIVEAQRVAPLLLRMNDIAEPQPEN